MTVKAEKAARRFYDLLNGCASSDTEWHYNGDPAKQLLIAAFNLYQESWKGYNIADWEWPFKTLRDVESFDGDEPWSVLLRRAVELKRSPSP